MIQRPNQAVILCGGRGMRLRPITDDLPKPMAPVNGRPFLYYLLDQMSSQGIKNFVLLTGYLHEKISDYFGDGSKFGWTIIYSTGPAEWDTGRRIREARALINKNFLLLYSDNFVQFNLNKLISKHKSLNLPITLTLAPKHNGNIKISENGMIEAYDKSRNGENFDYVEVGYMLVQRDLVLNFFPTLDNFPNFNFSSLLEIFAAGKKIAGLIVLDDYHSISDPKRLLLAEEYLKPKKILLLDRDGTINQKAPAGEYISNWSSFTWMPKTRSAMKLLAQKGFKFIIITNQAGIARKMVDEVELSKIHWNMVEEFAQDEIEILRIYMCPEHWNANSPRRKPLAGMFFEAARDFKIRMDHCMYVGDDIRDCEAASNAGCGMVYLSEENIRPQLENNPYPFIVIDNLEDAVNEISGIYQSW